MAGSGCNRGWYERPHCFADKCFDKAAAPLIVAEFLIIRSTRETRGTPQVSNSTLHLHP
ncbi:hypothetical protein NXC12_PD00231 (plasmid) [Rhizobium etli]|uniref:Uncharacterized protein n=1 Tax=Rhizobium etli TaxID=29449 RepID=A0AAN1BLN4_RHIET|nr:hypothetical protein NXC12_PD00231 [Rhizobium etli]